MERNQTAFIKQSITATRNWDDFQLLLRRCRKLMGNDRPQPVEGKR